MSNPAVCLLADNIVHGAVLRIEDNLGEAIHIHLGDIRLSLTISEFEHLYQAVKAAAKYLLELENIDLDLIDLSSLDWNWLSDYEQIETISIRNIRLGDLYTINKIDNDEKLAMIVPLKKSIYVKALKGKIQDLKDHIEFNMYNQSSESRLFDMKSKIKREGYPFEKKYIMISSGGRIYDGDHRAACLYDLYGENYIIPVIELKFKDELRIEELIRKNKFHVYINKCKKDLKRLLRAFKNNKHFISGKTSLIECKSKISINDIIHKIKATTNYYMIDYAVINHNERINYTVIVENFKTVKENLEGLYTYIYEDYDLLYSLSRPLLLKCVEGNVIIWEALCCKSNFEKALLPLDKYCNEKSWINLSLNEEKIYTASTEIKILYVLVNCMLEKQAFDEDDKILIKQNPAVLENKEFGCMLEKIFFAYKDNVIRYLKQGRFDECINQYLLNKEY